MKTFKGYLLARLVRVGTRSEGPEYFLQLLEDDTTDKDFPIEKQVDPWQNDPLLHKHVAKKVIIEGMLGKGIIIYEEIEPATGQEEPFVLNLKLEGHLYSENDNVLHINKMPSPVTHPPALNKLTIALVYNWPGAQPFRGSCPTSQFFEFLIQDPVDDTIWQWSRSILFVENESGVEIPSNTELIFTVDWNYFSKSITKAGIYKIIASFLPSGQEVTKSFEIKFAH